LSAIPFLGIDITRWIWGGPSISQPSLKRFFSLHFLLPLIIAVVILVHLVFLHEKGSSSPLGIERNKEKLKFHSLFLVKDLTPMVLAIFLVIVILSNFPNLLGDVENFSPANPLVAPAHIQPEWYFLFAYVILRSIPSKVGGVLALCISILILLIFIPKKSFSFKFLPIKKIMF